MKLVVIFFIGLLVLGPKKLPEVARAVGRGIIQFKRAMNAPDEETEGEDDRRNTADGDTGKPE